MLSKKVLISSFYNRDAIAPALVRLSKQAEVLDGNSFGRSLTEDEIISRLDGVDVVIAAEEPYTERVFASSPSLRMIARDGVGVNNIDLEVATRFGVIVNNAPVVHESVADLAMGLVIAAVRRMVIGDRGMRQARWTDRDAYLCPDVNGKALGLIGFGRIAQAVARRAAAFDMRLLAYDPYPNREAAGRLSVRLVELDELLAASDIVSIHTPLTPETENLINAGSIGKMKTGAYLINTSRGEVVDEAALIDALTTGKLAGAGLDVVCDEPPSADNPLFKFDNVVFTPHVGSDTYDTFRKVFETVVDDILLYLSGERPRHVVNPEVFEHERLKAGHTL